MFKSKQKRNYELDLNQINGLDKRNGTRRKEHVKSDARGHVANTELNVRISDLLIILVVMAAATSTTTGTAAATTAPAIISTTTIIVSISPSRSSRIIAPLVESDFGYFWKNSKFKIFYLELVIEFLRFF